MSQPAGPREDAPPIAAPDDALTWADFQGRLAAALARMRDETFLIISTPGDEGSAGCYVQFAAGAWGLRAEAVSSRFLPADRPLTGDQEATLAALAWLPPGVGAERGPNWSRLWPPPAPFDEIAALAIRTLREVYGVSRPAALRHIYRSFERVLEDPDLGIPPERPVEGPAAVAHRYRTAEELRPLVERALEGWLGLDELVRDTDGDYPVRIGSAVMFVQLLDGVPPVVRIFSPILHDVDASPTLFEALNEINARIRFGRVLWAGHQVVVAMELTAADLTETQVVVACTQLGNLADHLDDGLHGRFGGATAFASRPTLVN